MPLPRRAALALVAALAFGGPAPGQPAAADPPAGVPVEVERADGSKFTGTLALPAVTIRAKVGGYELDLAHLQTLTLEPADGGGVLADAVMDDGTHLQGRLQTREFPVTAADRAEVLSPIEVRSVTVRRPDAAPVLSTVLALVTLTVMEIVLGVDNIIVLAVLAGRLPESQRPRARRYGLIAALGTRLGLLFALSWLLGLTRPLFTLPELPLLHSAEARGVSGRDLILLLGGAFLIRKSVKEMHENVEPDEAPGAGGRPGVWARVGRRMNSFTGIILQIAVVDIVFSLDSVVTAVGMADHLWVMITAMVCAVGVMMVSAGPIARFVEARPTVKVLALSFLILIGVLLVAEGLGLHINKGYIYFAMAFAVGVELINLRQRRGPAEATRGKAAS